MINREDLLSGTRPEIGNKIIITVMEGFQGYEVIEYKGMVWGISMRSKDAVQDFAMGCKTFTGGELTSYTELADECRQRAIDRMLSMARRIGANAIINFKFEQTSFGDSQVTAFGNAVVIKPIKNYVPTGGLGNILAEFVDAYTCSVNGKHIPARKVEKKEFPVGKLTEQNGNLFVTCPHCGMLYGIERLENGQIKIKNFEDADTQTDGQQVACIKCENVFTVPQSV